MRITKSFLLFSLLALAGSGSSFAVNANYAPGDLILYFQKVGDTDTVYANLGNAATLFRGDAAGPGAANMIEFLDLSTTLSGAFGEDWATSGQIYAGLAGVWGTSNTSALLQNGDPHRTLYLSVGRNGVATVGQADSTGWDLTLAGNGAMDGASLAMSTQNNILENNYETAVAISPTGTSMIDEQNPLLQVGDNTVQGNAFNNNIPGGVQQVGGATPFGDFGDAGSVEFALDLYRILARNNIATQVAGDLRVGSFEGTVTVGTNGKVSFISQGSGPVLTPFQTWANTFPALDTEAKKLPSADPDLDGLTNLMEFTLNGNPGVADVAIRPSLANTTNDLVFNFNRRDEILTGYTLRFQYGSSLTGWTEATVPATSGTSGSTTVTVADNGLADAVSVALPKSLAVGGKLFARLLVAEVPAP